MGNFKILIPVLQNHSIIPIRSFTGFRPFLSAFGGCLLIILCESIRIGRIVKIFYSSVISIRKHPGSA